MKKKIWLSWGALFALCALLGFVNSENSLVQGGKTALSVLFFLPPMGILYRSKQQGSRHEILLVRNLAGLSLLLTMILLLASIRLALVSEGLGLFLHGLLTVVSAPMLCSGYWVLSLFLWACLLVAGLRLSR